MSFYILHSKQVIQWVPLSLVISDAPGYVKKVSLHCQIKENVQYLILRLVVVLK